MKKKNFVKRISKDTNLKRKECEKIFERVIELISSELKSKMNVHIDGFGDFIISNEEMKILTEKYNTKTLIPPKEFISFKPSENLVKSINPNG